MEPDVTPVRVNHCFDELVLQSYLEAHGLLSFDGPSISSRIQVRQFVAGQSNPTFLVTGTNAGRTTSIVIRKKPNGHLLPKAHAVRTLLSARDGF